MLRLQNAAWTTSKAPRSTGLCGWHLGMVRVLECTLWSRCSIGICDSMLQGLAWLLQQQRLSREVLIEQGLTLVPGLDPQQFVPGVVGIAAGWLVAALLYVAHARTGALAGTTTATTITTTPAALVPYSMVLDLFCAGTADVT